LVLLLLLLLLLLLTQLPPWLVSPTKPCPLQRWSPVLTFEHSSQFSSQTAELTRCSALLQVWLLARAFYAGECPPREPEEEVPAGQRTVRRDKVHCWLGLVPGKCAFVSAWSEQLWLHGKCAAVLQHTVRAASAWHDNCAWLGGCWSQLSFPARTLHVRFFWCVHAE